MLKVLIADDEKKVCRLIVNLVDWEQLGFEIVGIVNDGISAYKFIQETPVDVMICDTRGELISRNEEIAAILERMCKANWLNERIEGETVSRTILKGTLEILLADVVNVEEEIAKCEKELERLAKEIQRCEGMLNNQNFISKAPQAKINAEKDKLTNYREQYDLTQATLVKLKG